MSDSCAGEHCAQSTGAWCYGASIDDRNQAMPTPRPAALKGTYTVIKCGIDNKIVGAQFAGTN